MDRSAVHENTLSATNEQRETVVNPEHPSDHSLICSSCKSAPPSVAAQWLQGQPEERAKSQNGLRPMTWPVALPLGTDQELHLEHKQHTTLSDFKTK